MLLAFPEEWGLLNTLLASDATRFEVTSPLRDFAITSFHGMGQSY
jgi:hypothetical protein